MFGGPMEDSQLDPQKVEHFHKDKVFHFRLPRSNIDLRQQNKRDGLLQFVLDGEMFC